MVDIAQVVEDAQGLKLLYVEDNDDARMMTSMILEDFFSDMITGVDGEDGLQKFLENDIDIIITDINMPKMNGLEFAKAVRQTDKGKDVSIIVLSAHNEDSFFLESIHIGIDGFLLKPIELDQLVNVFSRIIQKHKFAQEAKENMHFLEVYQKAASLSSIVSKTDPKGIITYVNDAFCAISGFEKEELIGKNHNIVRHPDNPASIFEEIWHTIRDKKEVWRGIVRNKTKDNKSYYVDSLIMPIIDLNGEIIEYISLRHDVSDIMNPQKQLSNAIKNAKNPLLIYMKLDKYAIFEEFYEHEILEEIETKTAQLLEELFSAHYNFDKVFQLGNGEFALVSTSLDDATKEKLVETIKSIQEKIQEHTIHLENLELDIAVLVSIVYEYDKVLESAKLGMKKLLKTRRDLLVANDMANQALTQAQENMKTVTMIKKAIESSKIVSYFQPIVDNVTQKVVKYESLVRLIDENETVLSPYHFLEISKKSNYYSRITNIVLEHSFCILKNCDVDISINLSAIDIEQKATRQKIYNLLENNKEDAKRVVFELLEDENIKEFDVIKTFISKVKEYGVKIAIDDFGAGYSNYERLLDYQPDILKIDGCLIRNIETSSYSRSAVKSIVTFAQEQNIKTVAEFIENEEIFTIVKELGVDFSQGYHFGKPEPLKG